MRRLLTLLCVVGLSACATASPEAQAWYAERDKHPTTFEVEADRIGEVMARAAVIVAKEVSMPISVSTDRVIQTEMPVMPDARIGAVVTATPLPNGSFRVEVITRYANVFSGGQALRIARAIAYYANRGIEFPG